MIKFLTICAGDGSYNATAVGNLQAAIKLVRDGFEAGPDDLWVADMINNPDEWDGNKVGRGRMGWNGEQCHFEVIEITEVAP